MRGPRPRRPTASCAVRRMMPYSPPRCRHVVAAGGQVAAGAEDVATPGQDACPELVVVVQQVEGVIERVGHRPVDGIPLLGSFHGDDQDTPVPPCADALAGCRHSRACVLPDPLSWERTSGYCCPGCCPLLVLLRRSCGSCRSGTGVRDPTSRRFDRPVQPSSENRRTSSVGHATERAGLPALVVVVSAYLVVTGWTVVPIGSGRHGLRPPAWRNQVPAMDTTGLLRCLPPIDP